MSRRWRKDSTFGAGPRIPRDREFMAQWRARIGFLRRAGRLTPLAAEIALALARRLGQDGQLDPAHATLADDAGAGCRTVQRALAALSGLGMLHWVRRLVRDGSHVEQTSNAYALLLPAPVRIGDGQCGRATRKNESYSLAATATAATATAVAQAALNKALTGLTAAGRAALATVRAQRARTLGLLV